MPPETETEIEAEAEKRKSKARERSASGSGARMILFPIYGMAVLWCALRWRRRWPSFVAVGLGTGAMAAIGVLLGAEDVVFGMRARLLVMLLWGEALVVGGLGLYAAMLPRRRGEMDCHTCGYHLDGLEMSGPRGDTITCPECGQPWKRPEVVELTPIPKGPRRKRTGI